VIGVLGVMVRVVECWCVVATVVVGVKVIVVGAVVAVGGVAGVGREETGG
jgi:hypothetical protein